MHAKLQRESVKKREMTAYSEKRFRYEDPTVYEWIITGSNRSISLFLVTLVSVTTVIPGITLLWTTAAYLALTSVLGLLLGNKPEKMFPILFVWVPIIVMAAFPASVLRLLWLARRGNGKKNLQAISNLQELTGTAIGVFAFLIYGPLSSGFEGEVHSIKQFGLFLLDCGVRAIFLDLPEAFHFRLSTIHPVVWYASVAEVLLTFSITAGLVGFFWGVYRRRFGKMLLKGTVQQCYWKCENLLDRDTLQLRRESILLPLSGQSQTKVEPLPTPDDFVGVVAFLESLGTDDFEWHSRPH
jgi:hypothetical protein